MDIYDNLTVVRQLMKLNDVDFDKVDGVRKYTTSNSDEAMEWMDKEIENGYITLSYFDKETGEHICKSIPKEKVSLPTEDELLPLLDENGEFLLDDEDELEK
jgi:hypothetical protein